MMNQLPACMKDNHPAILRCQAPPEFPETMAELLETAIADARKLDREAYYPHYEHWHNPDPDPDGACSICLAGSVIAGTLKASPHKSVYPDAFSDDVTSKLSSLDCMRQGSWRLAYERFYGREPSLNTSEGLTFLPQPVIPNFHGWDDFQEHLDSLEKAVQPLRQVEIDAEPV